MPTMIEALIGAGVQRPDEKRIVPTRRPLPNRPRDLFELLVSLGQQASMPAIFESSDLRQADPRHLTYIALSRWPTLDELQAQPDPYNPRNHLRTLVMGKEFRATLIRRICDAYPERPRLLHVRIPRCAGQHFTQMAGAMHAIVPPGIDQWQRGDMNTFIPALGAYLGRFNLTRTIKIDRPSLAPFTQVNPPLALDPSLPWSLDPPPRRPGDRLFTIIREPAHLILSEVNGILTALRQPRSEAEDAVTAEWRARLGALPPERNAAAWKALGRRVLAALPMTNPICSALGQGTAASALEACRLADIEIADLRLYADWVKYTWDVEPEPPPNASTPILTFQDLDAEAAGHLKHKIAEDLIFYAPINAAFEQLPELRTSIRGRDL